ncbi:hypothetical protein HMI54_004795 [Coelomomyces lativittatus]|nr:hypothetical protein HMI54_004795 [Coelomomyces lativittatus]
MNNIKAYSSKIEDLLDLLGTPLKPYLPGIGRFLMVVTFLEDSLRIMYQWDDQVWYLQKYRGLYWGFTQVFLILNVLAMLSGSYMAIVRKHTVLAVTLLFLVMLTQSLAYGLFFDVGFFLRNLSVTGGLLMLLAEAFSYQSKKKIFPGIPELSDVNRSTYLQLAGRVLLIFLFFSLIFAGDFNWLRLVFASLGVVACIMVAVGFKAKWSAMFLVMFLSIFNVIINNWWSLHHTDPHRDFIKYDFFQILSVVGGFLLLVNMGPGGISVDEKKKAF